MNASTGLDCSPPRSLCPRSFAPCSKLLSSKPTSLALCVLLLITLFCPISLAQPDLEPVSLSPDLQIVNSHGSALLHHHKRTPLPRPFDTSLTDNFTTSSCPAFFSSFLSNSTISSCHAISLLLRDSTAFFHVLSSRPATSRSLDAACAAPFDQCSTIFSDLASAILTPDNCKQDFSLGNPLVRNALHDFLAYEPLYKASCLSNPATGHYCFLDAVFSNRSADYNVYFLPLGVDLPPHTDNLTCNDCLMATMDLFSSYATRDGQPLAESYLPSAKVVRRVCGEGFADLNVSVGDVKAFAMESASVSMSVSVWGWGCLMGLAYLGFVWLI